jgi:hypothetical protein
MGIDNFDKIKEHLSFRKENDFYIVSLILRKKENKDKLLGKTDRDRVFKDYFIKSVDDLLKYKSEIISICDLLNARAMIQLIPKNNSNIIYDMNIKLGNMLLQKDYTNLNLLYFRTALKYYKKTDKYFLLDVDEEDVINLNKIKTLILNISINNQIIIEIPSKTGYHLITKPFNKEKFKKQFPKISVTKNQYTNLYIPQS